MPQNYLKVPRVYLSEGAPKVFQGAPTLLQAHTVTATSTISQLQALATGICSI